MCVIIGYDLRLQKKYYLDAWKRENLGFSLSETAWPMSIDTLVWPSLFSYEEDENCHFNREGRGPGNLIPEVFITKKDPITFNNEANRLWSSWREMLSCTRLKNTNYETCSKLVCFQLLEGSKINNNWYIENCEPLPLAETRCSILGYEVCDSTLLTCHKILLRQDIEKNRDALNNNYLFKSQSDAERFMMSLSSDASYLSPAIVILWEIEWF